MKIQSVALDVIYDFDGELFKISQDNILHNTVTIAILDKDQEEGKDGINIELNSLVELERAIGDFRKRYDYIIKTKLIN
jgi:hypothetical protein